jgi:hypothetical protein
MQKNGITVDQLRKALIRHQGNRTHAAEELGVTDQWVRQLIAAAVKRGHKFPHCAPKQSGGSIPEYTPTLEEIWQIGVKAIQATWSRTEERARRGLRSWDEEGYTIPTARFGTLDGMRRMMRS